MVCTNACSLAILKLSSIKLDYFHGSFQTNQNTPIQQQHVRGEAAVHPETHNACEALQRFIRCLTCLTHSSHTVFSEDGLLTLQVLEDILLKGQDEYTEINMQCIQVHLPAFRHNYTFSSTAEHGDHRTGLPACVCGLFSQAEALLFRLLLGISVLSSDRKEL